MGYTQPLFNVRKVVGGYSIYPDGVTTDDLTIYPNPVDTEPYINLLGASNIEIDVGANKVIILKYGGTSIGYLAPDANGLNFYTYSNRNIAFYPNGSGLVKFGVRTATGDAASNGYITILDAAGNTVKLMTTA